MDNNKELKLGLGDAILRLVKVQFQSHLSFGDTRKQNQEETSMIVEALNQYELDLGFDCNLDGQPDTVADIVAGASDVDIFNVSAKTSCCRIMKEPKKSSSRSTKTSSRRKASRKKR